MKRIQSHLPALTRLTFGSGGITDPTNPAHLKVTRAAMDAGVWFHVGNYANGVYPVLKKSFAEAPSRIPKVIFKLDGVSRAGFITALDDALKSTGLSRIDIGQVCGNTLCGDTDALVDALLEARAAGKVGSYIMDVVPNYSSKVVEYVRDGVFDGYILYYNVTERGMSNAALDEVEKTGTPLLAMRTFGGRDGTNFVSGRGTASAELEQIFARSGCRSRVEFCVRFALSAPCVRTTVGSTSHVEHLAAFIEAGEQFKPLPTEITSAILALHRKTDAGGKR